LRSIETLWQVLSVIWLFCSLWVGGLAFAVWTVPRLLRKRHGEYAELTTGQIVSALLTLASGFLAYRLAFHAWP
jgi:formate-dependent nitrite reductase membrane component NrfD